jgi:LPXTG-motif cell wall-anchored protein
MRVVNVSSHELSALYIATLAAMDGSGAHGRTPLTVGVALLALVMTLPPAALAQSAGDRQYSDPLVTDGGDEPSPSADPDTPVSSDDPAPAGGDTGTTTPPAGAEPAATAAPAAEAPTLPHTGSDAWLLALAGVALSASGGFALAAARRPRDASR